jgi:nicotinamidase/pyrazinamidase
MVIQKKDIIMKFNKIVASFDVDPQKGFTNICPKELPIPDGENIVDELNAQALLANYRVGSRDLHPAIALWNAETPDNMFEPVGLPNVDIKWNPHCVMGTLGAEILDGLPTILEYDFMATKGMQPDSHPYGACYHDLSDKISTGIIEFLKLKKVKIVVVGGLATEFCVMTTVLQLLAAGFIVIINLAAIRGLDGADDAIIKMSKMDNVAICDNAEAIKELLAA